METMNGYVILASAQTSDTERVILGRLDYTDGGSSWVVSFAPLTQTDEYRGWYSGTYFDGSDQYGEPGARAEFLRRVDMYWH